MVIRAFILIAGAVMAAGFLWFAGNIIRLGLKEFFKSKDPTPATPAVPATPVAPAATAAAATTSVAP